MNTAPDRLWTLVSLQLAGEASQEELSELNGLLKAFPEAVFQAEMMKELWLQKPKPNKVQAEDAFSKHLQRLSTHLSEPVLQYEVADPEELETPVRSLRTWWWIGGVAASLMLAVGMFFQLRPARKAPQQNVVSTRPGSKSKVELPDGTVVWLNSGSRLVYDDAFNTTLREVKLIGEAYFEVAKDKTKPFIIHTQTVDLKVLGTAFNLRAYPDEATTETALIHGSVEVQVLHNPDKKIVLKPSEKLVVQNKPDLKEAAGGAATALPQPMISISKVHPLERDSTLYETSWVSNKLAFDNESLVTIAQRLERWYDVTVFITNEELKQTTYTAVFEGEQLEEVMNALQLSGGFNYSINRKEVRISP
ncbi:FecR family protein [Cnuella takakiae]|uniref:FecR family protein n=1 Tax=Cnuella takakiae TaxID=1302690 RepID=A0A1M4YFR5_9BACT|nr:FecR family protein [Cnuella takakiae]OLY93135.1 hypothetical protein BUE76_15495 [Cnuella takakiae]SHF04503.1 FecR family protein [Cnuella takakiae]